MSFKTFIILLYSFSVIKLYVINFFRMRTQLKFNFEYLPSDIVSMGFIIKFIDKFKSFLNCFFAWDILVILLGDTIVDFILSKVFREKSTNSFIFGYFFFVSVLNFLYSLSISLIKNKSSSIIFLI